MGDTSTVKSLLDRHESFSDHYAQQELIYDSIKQVSEEMLKEDRVEKVDHLKVKIIRPLLKIIA